MGSVMDTCLDSARMMTSSTSTPLRQRMGHSTHAISTWNSTRQTPSQPSSILNNHHPSLLTQAQLVLPTTDYQPHLSSQLKPAMLVVSGLACTNSRLLPRRKPNRSNNNKSSNSNDRTLWVDSQGNPLNGQEHLIHQLIPSSKRRSLNSSTR
jgi:hypothetical protein